MTNAEIVNMCVDSLERSMSDSREGVIRGILGVAVRLARQDAEAEVIELKNEIKGLRQDIEELKEQLG